jgi:hypothetical protein
MCWGKNFGLDAMSASSNSPHKSEHLLFPYSKSKSGFTLKLHDDVARELQGSDWVYVTGRACLRLHTEP